MDIARTGPRFVRTKLVWPCALVMVSAIVGCARHEEPVDPLATPALEMNTIQLAIGDVAEAQLSFTVLTEPMPVEDLMVFVHFVDQAKKLLWADDHDPPQPTSSWAPGETITYTRAVFVPDVEYTGPASVLIGLYTARDGARIPLRGPDVGSRAYHVASVRIGPSLSTITLDYDSGWFPPEHHPDETRRGWRWTGKAATLSFRNPARDAVLYLQLGGPAALAARPKDVTVSVGSQIADRFAIEPGVNVRRIPLRAGQLGSEDQVTVRLEVDRTFIPRALDASNPDDRELGIQVVHAGVTFP